MSGGQPSRPRLPLIKVLAVAGTRPEAVKLAPVVRRLKADRRNFLVRLCAAAQHRGLLDAMLADFGLKPDFDCDLMRQGQSPQEVLRRAMAAVERVLRRERPDLVLVQGDTSTALGAALAAFHLGVAVGHVEAGLRTHDSRRPFPEEKNRVLIDHLSDLLFAPTPLARRNLLREGINKSQIMLSGNTAVDALLWASRRPHAFREPRLKALPAGRRLAVVTLHRRESFGAPLEGALEVLEQAARTRSDLLWVFPVHPNPEVRGAVRRLLRHPRIILTPSLAYLDFVHLMKRAEFLVTDSGGIQEEAATLGKPVLVVRDKTERPEVLERGGVLAGTGPEGLRSALTRFSERRGPRPAAIRKNPFGDGRAAERIRRALLDWARGFAAPGRSPRHSGT